MTPVRGYTGHDDGIFRHASRQHIRATSAHTRDCSLLAGWLALEVLLLRVHLPKTTNRQLHRRTLTIQLSLDCMCSFSIGLVTYQMGESNFLAHSRPLF